MAWVTSCPRRGQQPLQLELGGDLVLVEQLGDHAMSVVHAVTIVSAPIQTRHTPAASAAAPASQLGDHAAGHVAGVDQAGALVGA